MVREFHRMAQLEGAVRGATPHNCCGDFNIFQLNGVLDETLGTDLPITLQLKHKFIQLLLGVGQNKEALGTIQDAAAHGELEMAH